MSLALTADSVVRRALRLTFETLQKPDSLALAHHDACGIRQSHVLFDNARCLGLWLPVA